MSNARAEREPVSLMGRHIQKSDLPEKAIGTGVRRTPCFKNVAAPRSTPRMLPGTVVWSMHSLACGVIVSVNNAVRPPCRGHAA